MYSLWDSSAAIMTYHKALADGSHCFRRHLRSLCLTAYSPEPSISLTHTAALTNECFMGLSWANAPPVGLAYRFNIRMLTAEKEGEMKL